jgi:drug/metabolite transporter (DMT)-like permease
MIVHTTNILLAPLAVLAVSLIWALNLFVIAATVRLLAGRIGGERAERIAYSLASITDPLPQALARRLARRGRSVPTWLPWLCVMVGVAVLQQLLVMFVLALG